MTSIRQLARLAGVSPSTVFQVLHRTGHISPATRERVLELAALYQYSVAATSPGESRGARRLIGCVIPGTGGRSEIEMFDVLGQRAFRESYSLLQLQTTMELLRTRKALLTLCELGVAGMVVHSGHFEPIPRAAILQLWTHGIAMVAYDVTPTEVPIDHVSADMSRAGELIVDHLFGLGHRRFLLIDVLSRGFIAGYPRAVKEALSRRRLSLHHVIEADQTIEEIEARLRTCLQRPDRPTALMVANTHLTFRVARMAQHCGLRVPQDLSIVSGNDAPLYAPYHVPPLTAIYLPSREVAQCATDLLFTRMADPTEPGERAPVTQLIPPKLMVRESCAPPPRLR